MINFNIKIEGLAQLVNGMTGLKNNMKTAIADGMKEAAFVVEGAAKRQITSGSNRAIKTGYLRSSIGVSSLLPLRATVTAQANYGIYVHEGTRYMKSRPFLASGLADAVPEIERIFGKRVQTLMEFN